MPTRIYFPSSGEPAVTPSTWNFANQINPVTLAGVTTRVGSAMATKVEATGTTNPTARAMMRYVVGPLAAQTISGTVKGQVRCSENNSGANATLALAIKIIQPNGTDRAVLLAQTASDDTSATPPEMAVSSNHSTNTNRRFQNAAENFAPALTSQSATQGDYLVIELGFRSATGTTRNIGLVHGDDSGTDLPEDSTTTAANNPWIEFSGTLSFYTPPSAGSGSVAGIGTLTGVGNSSRSGSGSVAGTGTLAGTGLTVKSGSGSVAGIGTLTGTGESPPVPPASGSGSVAGIGVLVGDGEAPATGPTRTGPGTRLRAGAIPGGQYGDFTHGTAIPSGGGSVAGTGALTGVGFSSRSGSGPVAGVGSVDGTGESHRSGSGSFAGTGTLTGAGESTRSGSGPVTGTGVLTGAGASSRSGAGSVAGTGVLAGTGKSPGGPNSGSGTVGGVGTLSGSGGGTRSGAGSVIAVGSVTGGGRAARSGAGSATGTGSVTGAGKSSRSGTGPVGGVGTLGGTGRSSRSGTGTLVGVGTLVGTGVGTPGVDEGRTVTLRWQPPEEVRNLRWSPPEEVRRLRWSLPERHLTWSE